MASEFSLSPARAGNGAVVGEGPVPGESAAAGEAIADIDLRRIYAAVRRNLIPIGAIIAACLVAGVVVTLLMVPQFVATSQVLIEQQTDQIIEDGSTQNTMQDADRFLQTQVDVITSRSLAERVVEAENLDSSEAFFQSQGVEMPAADGADPKAAKGLASERRNTAIELLRNALSVNLPVDSRMVAISFQGADRVVAADIANAVAENYIESNLARKFDSSAYAREFLRQQLEEARAKLETSERELNQYSRAAGLIRVSGQGQNADQETTLSVTNDSLVQINAAASAATAERIAAENRWQNIAGQSVSSIPQVLANPAFQNLVRQRSEIEARLAEERSRHLDGHPNVVALEQQVRETEQQIQTIGNAIKTSVKLEFEAARDRETSIQDRVSSIRSNALDEQDRGVQYNILKREAETGRALYNTLLTRYNELNATAGAASNNVSLVDRAQPPVDPSSPNLPLNLLLGLMGGMVLAGAFVFFREQFDDVLRTPEDIERKLGLPLFGVIPLTTSANPQDDLLDPKSPVSEAYQSLVTNLRYSSGEGVPRTLTVTSAQAGEGKTTTAHKLAQEFAELGKRTLLIDADLRRPTLHRRLDNKKQEGLTTILAGERTIEEVVVPSGRANLSYVTALPMPPDPAALLGASQLDHLVANLLERYDCVVFDAPPMLGLSDAPTLAAHTDSVLLVVDASSGNRGAVKAALRRLDMVRATITGIVLTKFDARRISGEYSYYGSDYYSYESTGDRR